MCIVCTNEPCLYCYIECNFCSKAIQHKYLDWKDFLVKRLTGARTLPHNFRKRLQQGLRDCPLKPSMAVEVVDKMCVSAMKVATVEQIVGGARVRLQYQGSVVSVLIQRDLTLF